MKGMRNIAPFGLRMPDELKEALAKRAASNGRSMNAEIVQIIEDALKTERIDWDDPFSKSKDDEIVSMSMTQFNKFVAIAAEDTAKAIVDNLMDKFDFTPKKANPLLDLLETNEDGKATSDKKEDKKPT